MELFKEEDPDVMHVKEEARDWTGGQFIEAFTGVRNRQGHIFMHVPTQTKKHMGELQWRNNGKAMG